jgi:hypothetical protein
VLLAFLKFTDHEGVYQLANAEDDALLVRVATVDGAGVRVFAGACVRACVRLLWCAVLCML